MKLLPINLGFGMFLTDEEIRLCIVFDKWAFDYTIMETKKLIKKDD